jgi:isoquinoline 1-oxidoreductase alpha subunit
VLLSDVVGHKVTTIEGLDPAGNHPVQKAWRAVNVPQCGFCQAGQIMQAASLLAANPKPSDQDIHDAMAGNICRCGCYQRIENAVRLAATGA